MAEANQIDSQLEAKIVGSIEIKSMPEQYLPKLGNGHPRIWILFILLIVILALGGGALYIWWQGQLGREIVSNESASTERVGEKESSSTPETSSPEAETTPNPVSNTPAGLPETKPTTPTPVVPQTPAPTPPPLSAPSRTQDSDQDKLTDLEESLYGTDLKLPDTDNDGHPDGAELVNLFDPFLASPAKIENSASIKILTNDNWGYEIMYPSQWVSRASQSDKREYLFTSAVGEFIEVLVQENVDKIPFAEWYLRQSPGIQTSELTTFATRRAMKGIKSPDQLTVYLMPDLSDPGVLVYTISYHGGTATAYNFLSTFEMMINSLRVNKAVQPSAQSQPASATPPSPQPTPTPSSSGNNQPKVDVGG